VHSRLVFVNGGAGASEVIVLCQESPIGIRGSDAADVG